jgi:hypothetical protein
MGSVQTGSELNPSARILWAALSGSYRGTLSIFQMTRGKS